jgi:predicted small lipoprotein YifL
MIKKIFFFLALSCFIVSCGKKGDPIYKDPEKKTDLQTVLENKA